MPRTDPSVALLTGLIIAALYVILLIGFSRESYMRHDAAMKADAARASPAAASVAKNVCRVDLACAVPP